MITIDQIKEQAKKDPRFLSVLRARLEGSFKDFCLVMFPLVYGCKFDLNWHHLVLIQTLERVHRREINRLLINMPPGYSKTELVVVLFSAWCLLKDPRVRFLHTSYSDDLALDNSSKVKDVLQSDLASMLWDLTLRTDSQAKKHWTVDKHRGCFIAAPMSGQITGRRAGVLGIKDVFSGALIIDDPLKPDDAHSVVHRTKVNRKFKNTIRNRVAREDIPIIVVMQRVHKKDLVGYLLAGGLKETWHHLIIKALDDPGLCPREYKREWAYGTPVKYNRLTRALWATKHTEDQLSIVRQTDPFDWAAQYQQDPTDTGLSIINENWWQYYKVYDPLQERIQLLDGSWKYLESKSIYADTAMKTGEKNDYSVFEAWGKLQGEETIVLLDLARDKWEAPDLETHFKDFILRHLHNAGFVGMGLRKVAVEDKASGTGLIQTLNRDSALTVQIEGIQRDKDKVSRAKSCAGRIKAGQVLLPIDAIFLGDLLDECLDFNENMTHDHDDQIDPLLDAIHDNLIDTVGSYDSFV